MIEKKPEEKATLMGLLKSISASVDKAREDVKKAMQMAVVKKSPADLQKELLDAELELFQAQQDGAENADEIQKKVNQLRIDAARSGLLPTSRPPRGRGSPFRGGRRGGFYSPRFRGGRGRGGRGGYPASGHTLDRRTTKIVVTGFEMDEKDELVASFQKFGELVESLFDENAPSATFQFKTRREAEVAMNGGKAFGEKMLNLSW